MKFIKYLISLFYTPYNSKYVKGDYVSIHSNNFTNLTGIITKIQRYKYKHIKGKDYFYLYLVEFKSGTYNVGQIQVQIKDFWFSEADLTFYKKEDDRDYKLKSILEKKNESKIFKR